MIHIRKTELGDIKSMRADYLNSLTQFQELYLEMFIENGEIYKIDYNGSQVGYAIKTGDNILVEFSLVNKFVPIAPDVFQAVVNELSITTIYCKSFDSLLLDCCLINSYKYHLIGCLFRDYLDTERIPIADLKIRFAESKDYPFLLQQEGELYETPEELERFVNGNNVILFQKTNRLLGCGYLIKVHVDYNYYDIGMWVNPAYRKQGVATLIISYLKDICLTNNWIPICGCAIENVASRKTLEKNGFITKYKLIEFKVQNN